ncbi:MAG TPA: 3'-5' exonuclease, partial [Cellvibrionaceae bacterium]
AGKLGKPLKDRFTDLVAAINDTQPEAANLLKQIHSLPDAQYSDGEWDLLSALTGLLPRLVGELRLVFQRLGATDFTEITLAAINALGDNDTPSDLALKLDYQIKHILVDEFQDTALPQLQLLEKLTAGWQPGDGRTLFIVGDGMQSCYGFRNANVGLFLGARQQGIGQVPLTPVELCVNFRSSAGIVHWVNSTFAEAFPALDDISRGAVAYTPSVAFNGGEDTVAVSVEVAPYYSDGEREQAPTLPDRRSAEIAEALHVVALAKAARSEDPEGSVAILARTRGHLSEIIRALNAQGIAFQANAMDALATRMAIVDLQSLTRALLLPDDRIAWLAILRAPWCGLDLIDLHTVANWQTTGADARGNNLLWCALEDPELPSQLSADGATLVRRIAPILQLAQQQRRRKSLRDWVYGTWLALGGPACLAHDSEQEDVKQYFNLLEHFDKAGQIEDWNAFNRALGQLYAAPMSNADEGLQVMTLHKSKGLEFDTVIIPGLNRGSRAQDKSLLLWRERLSANGTPQLLLGPLAKTGDDPGNLYQYLKQEQKQQDEYESTRLLYVGCTRASKRLHLTACISAKADTALADLKASGQLKCIWPSARYQAEPITINAAAPADSEREAITTLTRLHRDWQLPAAQDNLQLAQLRGKTLAEQDNIPARETREQRLWRHTGTVVHRALESLARAPLPANSQGYIAAQQLLWRNYLYQQKLAGSAVDEALARINRAVAKMLDNEQGRWVLDCHHSQAQVEAEFFSLGADGFHRQHIVDRTFIADGCRWIIDYKAAMPETEQSYAEFIAIQTRNYREQLQRYRLLFSQQPEPIKLALCFPLLEGDELLAIVEP